MFKQFSKDRNWNNALVDSQVPVNSECQVYEVAPMSLFVGKGRLLGDTLLASDWFPARLSGLWLADKGHDRVHQVSVSQGQGAGVLWNLEIIRE